MDGVQIYPNIFGHISFSSLKEEMDFEYVNFFKRCVKRSCILMEEIGPLMREILGELNLNFGITPLSYFANYYRNGNDYTPYHSDQYGDYKLLTVSFGCSRDFYFKHNTTKEVVKYKINHGDVVIFSEQVNKDYKHSIPKRTRLQEERISILFFY